MSRIAIHCQQHILTTYTPPLPPGSHIIRRKYKNKENAIPRREANIVRIFM